MATNDAPKIKPIPKRAAPPAKKGPSLTFSDGLNFGCGFWVTGGLFFLMGVPTIAFIIAILGLG